MATEDVQSEVHAYLSGAITAEAVTAYVAQIPQQFPGWTAQLEHDWPLPGDWTLRLASPQGPLQEYWLHPEDATMYLMAPEPLDGPRREAQRSAVAESQPFHALLECLEVMAVAGEEWIGEPELLTACVLALEDAGGREDELRARALRTRVADAYGRAGHVIAGSRYSVEALIAVVETIVREAAGLFPPTA